MNEASDQSKAKSTDGKTNIFAKQEEVSSEARQASAHRDRRLQTNQPELHAQDDEKADRQVSHECVFNTETPAPTPAKTATCLPNREICRHGIGGRRPPGRGRRFQPYHDGIHLETNGSIRYNNDTEQMDREHDKQQVDRGKLGLFQEQGQSRKTANEELCGLWKPASTLRPMSTI